MSIGLVVSQNGESLSVEVAVSFGEFAVAVEDFERATGWQLKPQGLCLGDVCVPVRDLQLLTQDNQIDLVEFARLVNQNIVFDKARKIAALGERADLRGDEMSTLEAPDFVLPDIHGKKVSFSDFNRRKRLLLAWSSW